MVVFREIKGGVSNLECKQYVLDFVEGRVKPEEFIETCEKSDEVFDWIQKVVPKQKMFYKKIIINGQIERKEFPYDIRCVWQDFLYEAKGHTMLGRLLNLHSEMTKLYKESFPNERINPDKTIEEKFNFFLEACPEYIGSDAPEMEILLEGLYKELPENLSKTGRVKLFKQNLKSLFHVEGQKYPRWLQEPEWPLSPTGKPMRFTGQKKINSDMNVYWFEDVDTKKKKKIIQFT